MKEIILCSILKITLGRLKLWISSCGENGVHYPRVSSSAKMLNVAFFLEKLHWLPAYEETDNFQVDSIAAYELCEL